MSVGQLICQTAVETERLQLQPDETEAVLVKQHKEPWGALWTCKAVPSNQTCPVETEKKRKMLIVLTTVGPRGYIQYFVSLKTVVCLHSNLDFKI